MIISPHGRRLLSMVATSGAVAIATLAFVDHLRLTHLARTSSNYASDTDVLGRVVLSSFSDHLVGGRRSVVYACAGCVAVGLAIAASLGDSCPEWCITALSISIGFFCFGWYGPWVVWLSESADRHQVGEVLGVAMSLNQISIAATPILFGYMVDQTVSFTMPWAAFALLLASTLTWHQWRIATGGHTLR